jgi:phosphatidylglycerol:prolipoprotein diacylglycerol transferase
MLFGRPIGLYPIMALCGIFAAGIYVCHITKKEGHDDNEAIVFLLVSAIGVLLGGHVLYGIVNYRYIIYIINDLLKDAPWKTLLSDFVTVFGGSVFYGGLLGGLGAAFLYLRKNMNLAYLIDNTAPAIPLFHFFGRIGCFLGGCCYGRESVWGITFTHSIIESANGVTRLPVQLLEAVFNLSLFIILNKTRKNNAMRGKLLYIYLMLYSSGRFLIEFLRGDDYRGKFLFLSTSQIISMFIFAIVLLKYNKKRSMPGYSD